MGGVMLAAQRAGLTGKLPPRKLTQRTLDFLHLPRGETTDKLATVGAHLSYGSACGKLYESTVRHKVMPKHPVAEGMLFGAGVWVASYFGWVPKFGLMQPPTRDRPDRSLVMFGAHLVFGGVLGKLSA
jgi:hypothetical protein